MDPPLSNVVRKAGTDAAPLDRRALPSRLAGRRCLLLIPSISVGDPSGMSAPLVSLCLESGRCTVGTASASLRYEAVALANNGCRSSGGRIGMRKPHDGGAVQGDRARPCDIVQHRSSRTQSHHGRANGDRTIRSEARTTRSDRFRHGRNSLPVRRRRDLHAADGRVQRCGFCRRATFKEQVSRCPQSVESRTRGSDRCNRPIVHMVGRPASAGRRNSRPVPCSRDAAACSRPA